MALHYPAYPGMIGIFDSGIGGLTVVRAVEKLLPHHSILYFGDTARTPYGTKSADVIIDYSLRNTEFLLKKGAQLIVIGCNSAASVATEHLRAEFHVPVVEVIAPAAQMAVKVSKSGRIGLIGTRATVRSGVYEEIISRLNPACKVFSTPCPLLVPLVEEGWTNKRETKMIIRRYLHTLKERQIDTLILGCTHYPLLKAQIQARMGRKVTLIDSSTEVADTLQQLLTSQKDILRDKQSGKRCFYLSDITNCAHTIASKIFGHPVEFLLP
ncbi:MAG: glutamate racemase [Desulfopila sp.]|jgi:glutamate racemase|nr:glutamate racemase [Desulfopila sp.]